MFQYRSKFNKISLICNNGTTEGKTQIIDLILFLINQPGWIIEAAGAVSWTLRKKDAPTIMDKNEIMNALDITVDNVNDIIEVNKNYNKNDKNSQAYTRIYHDTKNNKTYESNETLFGKLPCEFKNTNTCDRECKTNGGKIKKRKSKKRKSKKRNIKNKIRKSKTYKK